MSEWTKYSERKPELKDGPIMICEPGWDAAWYLEPSEVSDCWLQNGEVTFDWSDCQDWLWSPCPKPPSQSSPDEP